MKTKLSQLKAKVESELRVKDYYESQGRIYFLSLNGYVLSLSKTDYFQRLHKLQDFFKDREANEAKRLVKENLALGASSLPDKEYHPKTEIVYQSNAVTVFKISGYSPDEDYSSPRLKELTSARGEKLEGESIESWNTAYSRSQRVWDYLDEFVKKLRKELGGN